MCRQGAVQLIKLLATGGGHRDGDAKVVAALAFTELNGLGVKRGVELLRNHADGVHQAIDLVAHDFDGELRRVLDQGLCAWVGGVVAGGRLWGHARAFLGLSAAPRACRWAAAVSDERDYRFRWSGHPADECRGAVRDVAAAFLRLCGLLSGFLRIIGGCALNWAAV